MIKFAQEVFRERKSNTTKANTLIGTNDFEKWLHSRKISTATYSFKSIYKDTRSTNSDLTMYIVDITPS